ncbi:hypothetical protein [Dyella sp. ASV21]|uniref:hypothetical protein n=1 Tax=Dyella sp. ASV21 TaxID=2795114 RepID=UPI0018EC84F9|nr:hypothetical protein [Dyella sp. ASV21]
MCIRDSTHTVSAPARRDLMRPLRYAWRVPLLLLHVVLGVLCLLYTSPSPRDP